jgi:phenylacetate-coenzyme A ligase PaaK-like adenylate-forming protein
MQETDVTGKEIFSIKSETDFAARALAVFHLQYRKNVVYHKFVDGLDVDIEAVNDYREIPFLPIEFFKTHKVVSGNFEPEAVFQSSGTTGMVTSHHFVKDTGLYEQSLTLGFELFFGKPDEYVFLALLPSYLERTGSSLVYMANLLIRLSKDKNSGFYLHDYDKLAAILVKLKKQRKKVVLLGVTYALLDLAEQFPMNFPELILMETGGMKGKRREMVREELHAILCAGFGVKNIYSEYGMTELLSQAYSKGRGIFSTPPWMKVLIRDINDPLSLVPEGKSGGINVIDLTNIHSCSFIATQDLGKLHDSADFEVLGRFDNSDVRGCNLLIQ